MSSELFNLLFVYMHWIYDEQSLWFKYPIGVIKQSVSLLYYVKNVNKKYNVNYSVLKREIPLQ